MKQTLKRILFLALVVAGAAMTSTGASAADGSTHVTVISHDPVSSKIIVRNTDTNPCQVANTATGTVAITRVVQGGSEITPTPMEISFNEGLDTMLLAKLKTLKPGESVEIPLRTTSLGDKVALRPVSWSPTGGTLAVMYVVDANKPIEIELNYETPIDSPNSTPICVGAIASTIDDMSWTWRVVLGLVIIVAILAVILLLWLWSRRKKKKPAAAVVALIVLGGALAAMLSGGQVNARVTVPESVQGEWDSCMATLRANRDITGPVLDMIDNPSVNIIIEPTDTEWTEASSPWPDGSYHVDWNTHDGHRYYGGGGFEDSCTSMFHELYHILDMENGTFSRDDCAGSGIETKEVMATRAQNQLRVRLGMPARTHYGDRALPTGDCRETSPPPCRSGTCGRSVGEPHLSTFDGRRYDFQAVGEFTLAKVKEGAFDVQVRQQRWEQSRTVAVNVSVAIKTASHTYEVRPDGYKLSLLVDGKKQPLQNAEFDGDTVTAIDAMTRLDIAAKDGNAITLYGLGKYGVDAVVDPAIDTKGKWEGLLGDFDGDSKNDLRDRGSHDTIQADFARLYPKYADSWRVTNDTSLFTYDAGKNTDTYTDRAFPYEEFDASKLAGYKAAVEICKRFGVTDETSLRECAMDVAITGRSEFARSADRYGSILSGSSVGGTEYELKALRPGDIGKVTFDAKKDEKIFVDIYSSTFPSSCGTFSLRDAADKVIGDGCIINNKGFVETTIIPVDGTYSLQLRAGDATTGEARVRMYRVTDQTGTVKVDGDPVKVVIPTPGMEAHFTFAATAGQRLFANTTDATFLSQCSPIKIIRPNGQILADGCIINGKGGIDTVIAPESGQYTLVMNPIDITTGKLTLKLSSSQVVTKSLPIGESVRLNFANPGDEAEVRFTGVAGEKIYVDVFDSTLPSQCGGFMMRTPGGDTVDGCIIGTKDTLDADGITLPASGTYVVTINPTSANTGALTLKVRH